MTQLDTALATLLEDRDNEKHQSAYYDLFLNATFFVPIVDDGAAASDDAEEVQVAPLVLEADGCHYLMLFDSRERLTAWAGAEVPCVEVPGHLLAATTMDPLHWALNVGTDYSKSFTPAEIAWLREVVEKCEADAAQAGE